MVVKAVTDRTNLIKENFEKTPLSQKKNQKDNPKRFRMVEVVGLDEDQNTYKVVNAGRCCNSGVPANILFLPHSFKELAGWLMGDYRSLLLRNARDRRHPGDLKERAINPNAAQGRNQASERGRTTQLLKDEHPAGQKSRSHDPRAS